MISQVSESTTALKIQQDSARWYFSILLEHFFPNVHLHGSTLLYRFFDLFSNALAVAVDWAVPTGFRSFLEEEKKLLIISVPSEET